MDSVTQAALGAAVAHAGWHGQLGRRALLWGAALGTLPDLDVVAFRWLDSVQQLYWHRGPSHGWLFILVASAGVGWLLHRLHRARGLSLQRAWITTAVVLVTHVAIDLFTVYGTQILAPFSNYGFGTNNLFIIDPLYTLPLLIGIGIAAFRTQGAIAFRANQAGLLISSLYVVWSFVAQARADEVFARELQRQGIRGTESQTSATLLNTLLWRHLAKVEGGFVVGYWSWLDRDETVRFTQIPQNRELAGPVRETRAFQAVDWFSQGFWIAEKEDGRLKFSDLRFGETRSRPDAPFDEWQFVFSWHVGPGTDDPAGLQGAPDHGDRRAALPWIWRRIQGNKTAW